MSQRRSGRGRGCVRFGCVHFGCVRLDAYRDKHSAWEWPGCRTEVVVWQRSVMGGAIHHQSGEMRKEGCVHDFHTVRDSEGGGKGPGAHKLE